MTPRSICGAVAALLLFLPLACGDDTSTGGAGNSTSTAGNNAGGGVNTGGGNTGGGSAGGVSTGGGNTGGQPPLQIAECQGHVYACGDLEDNDNDGLTDSYDPDCLGPCDDTEDSYHGGIPGQNNAPCKMDCYFDQDTGAGNDDCYWDHRCDTHATDPNFYPQPWNNCEYEDPDYQFNTNPNYTCTTADMMQSDTCGQVCGPLTPNGCDCFGCCELPAGSGAYVYLGSIGADESTVCTIAEINNPAVCHPCDPVAACLNDCGECEVCIGKPEPGPECDPPGEGGGNQGGSGAGGGSSGSQCPSGVQPCGLPGQDPCAFGEYCITGCCIPEPAG